VRGATPYDFDTQYVLMGFNPRARAGRDTIQAAGGAGGAGFNPRARAGRDTGEVGPEGRLPVSIHAPVRGAT